jgi:hypothetical protein
MLHEREDKEEVQNHQPYIKDEHRNDGDEHDCRGFAAAQTMHTHCHKNV